jgi:hypothetical protein
MSIATRRSTPRRRPANTAKAIAAHIVARTSPIALAPMAAIASRFRRSPSRMIPSLSTLPTEKRMPARAHAGARPRLTTISPRSMARGTS